MKIKKIIPAIVVLSLLTTTYSNVSPVKAVDFEGNESKYMNLCSSSNISNSNKSTCEQFNKINILKFVLQILRILIRRLVKSLTNI